jgi:hypothetical protein
MPHSIKDFRAGQMVRTLDTREHGQVDRLDEDENTVYVAFPTRDGQDILDMDPGELEPMETSD